MAYSAAQRFWWFIYMLALVISFCLSGFWLVSRAIGYRYNPHLHKLQKTGLLIIPNAPTSSRLRLDDQTYELHQNTRIADLLPGAYRLVIAKTGYQDWIENRTINPGFVVTVDPVTLFRQVPLVVANPNQYANLVPFYTTRDDRIRITDGELWFSGKLVSRFSQPPNKAILWSSGHNLVYFQGREVRVIDIEGQHDQLLYTRTIDDPAILVQINDVLVFNEADGLRALQIQ